ncbi:MAG: Pentachlorophenol 4-monooxygenase [Chlamydiales bacterium]|nr:Pentachlorophenol 4-monooxygenase [Chlamydiales bacterium]MCH9620292.1 Pentachlorophenol 4-monooxygenase [Chlamydiales bacterium]MCH9622797.1 Pentachlorophenol 4-monooxygenase [Chlamydiales bacterium]
MTVDILIVGAGPTGLALAYELSRRGNPIRIIDKKEGLSTHSKALGIHARTLEILDKMGLIDDFLKVGEKKQGMYFHFGSSTGFVDFSTITSPFPFILSLPQSESEKILYRHLSVEVEWKTELVGEHEGEYLLDCEGKKECISPKWVIGCDGAHSFVRQSNQIPFTGDLFDHTFHMADIRGKIDVDYRNFHCFFRKNKPAMLIFSYREDRHRIISLKGTSWEHIEQEEVLWESLFTVNSRHASTIHFKNLFLVGDAAHVHSPAGGQGMNTSIQDGFNLAWKLDLVLKGVADPSFLNSYEEERLPIISRLIKMTRSMTYFIFFAPLPLRLLYKNIAKLLISLPFFNKKMAIALSQISLNYKGSSIVRGKKGLVAGNRFPDVQLENGQPLRSLLRTPKHVLFLFQKNHSLSDWIKKAYGQWIEVHCLSGERIQKQLNATADSLYLVRPDGYLGFSSLKRSHLERYLDSIFSSSPQ